MRLGNPVNTTPFNKKLSGVTVAKKKRRTTRKKKVRGRKK